MELFSENRISELETKIDNLISSYTTMREERQKLLSKLETLENENKELKERAAGTKSEREVIIDKISKILEKVEKVEV
jgi:septal ring factor EnvC (AmiA/AmiB activator)